MQGFGVEVFQVGSQYFYVSNFDGLVGQVGCGIGGDFGFYGFQFMFQLFLVLVKGLDFFDYVGGVVVEQFGGFGQVGFFGVYVIQGVLVGNGFDVVYVRGDVVFGGDFEQVDVVGMVDVGIIVQFGGVVFYFQYVYVFVVFFVEQGYCVEVQCFLYVYGVYFGGVVGLYLLVDFVFDYCQFVGIDWLEV